MDTYHKIQTVFYRDPDNNYKTLLEGRYSLPEFDFLRDCRWTFTEKVDGTNIRIMRINGIFEIRGKTDRADVNGELVNYVNNVLLPKSSLFDEVFGDADFCMYGEGYGGKIQNGSKTYGKTPKFVLFDVLINGFWLNRVDIEKIAQKLEIDIVPIVHIGTLMDMVDLCRRGLKSTWGDFQAEGLIAKPSIELKTRDGKRIITKLKCKDFAK